MAGYILLSFYGERVCRSSASRNWEVKSCNWFMGTFLVLEFVLGRLPLWMGILSMHSMHSTQRWSLLSLFRKLLGKCVEGEGRMFEREYMASFAMGRGILRESLSSSRVV